MPPPQALNPNEVQFAGPEFQNPNNPVSAAILRMRASEAAKLKYGLDNYRDIFALSSLDNEDERFLTYVLQNTPNARAGLNPGR